MATRTRDRTVVPGPGAGPLDRLPGDTARQGRLGDAGPLDRLLGTVGDVMTREVVSVHANAPAIRAMRELTRRDVTAGAVIDRGEVVGMVTVSGMRRWATPAWAVSGPFTRHVRELTVMRVRDLMHATPVARSDWPVARAARAMHEAGVTMLPVVNDLGGLIGVVSRDDVVRAVAMAATRPAPAEAVPPDEGHPGCSVLLPD